MTGSPLGRRVTKLERRDGRGRQTHPYVVEIAAGETADQAIARAAPSRPFFLLPAPITCMHEWARAAAAVLER